MKEEQGITIKKAKPPKKEKKSNAGKPKKKPGDQPLNIDFVESFNPDEPDSSDLNLDELTSEQLTDETKRIQIRHKLAQTAKIEKENAVRDGLLVARVESMNTMKHLCVSAVEILDLVPDQLAPNLYKKTKKQIRANCVKHMDMIKKRFISKLMELEENEHTEEQQQDRQTTELSEATEES